MKRAVGPRPSLTKPTRGGIVARRSALRFRVAGFQLLLDSRNFVIQPFDFREHAFQNLNDAPQQPFVRRAPLREQLKFAFVCHRDSRFLRS